MVVAADSGQPDNSLIRQNRLGMCVADAVLIGLDDCKKLHAALVGQAPSHSHRIAQVFERFGDAAKRPVCQEPLPVTGVIVVPVDATHTHPVQMVEQLCDQIFGPFDALAVVGEVHQR